MRILVVSDTHGSGRLLIKLFEKIGGADALIHAGDGAADVEAFKRRFPELPVYSVPGNCDPQAGRPAECCCRIGGVNFLIAHGHTLSVKRGIEEIEGEARLLGAEVAVFGHTHKPLSEYYGGLWLLNPGSLAMTKYGSICFATVDIVGGHAVCALSQMDYSELN